MKMKRTLTIGAALVALAVLTTLGLFRGMRIAKAQDEVGPPIHVRPSSDRNRISSGIVGIARGQTIRLNVVNIADAGCPCWHAVLTFLDDEGQTFHNGDGSIIRRVVPLEPGRAKSLELSCDELPPGPIDDLPPSPIRLQLRATVKFLPPGSDVESGGFERMQPLPDSFITSVEVFNNDNGQTQLLTHPAEVKGFNPQPDPPRVQ